jgi:RNA polymerase sigma-70 factor (ECF subfamily)
VAVRAFPFTRIAQVTLPALINGAAGIVTAADGRPITLVAFTITGAKIVAIDLIDDSRSIAEADLAILGSHAERSGSGSWGGSACGT